MISKKSIIHILTGLCLLVVFQAPLSVNGQNDQKDRALATQYYNNGEFEKAAEYFEKLWSKDSRNHYYYSNLYRSLLNLEEYDRLEKIVKKQIKKNKTTITYLVDMGYLLKKSGKLEEATGYYDQALSQLTPDDRSIRGLANAFKAYREEDYLIATYLKGNELIGDPSRYHYELGLTFLNAGENEKSVKYFLDYVDKSPNMIQRVKNVLQSSKAKTAVLRELEKQLYGRIQQQPNKDVYTETLIWTFVQRKDFESAMMQAKAMDKRKNERGNRILKLSRQALIEEDYESAIDGFEYALERDPNNRQIMPELLRARKLQLTNAYQVDMVDVIALKMDYEQYLVKRGRNSGTAEVIMELANLEAFYIHDLSRGITLMEEVIGMVSAKPTTRNRAKLLLGDFYLLEGEIWESTLLYSQVDKAEKDSPLGEEARFKNAKLAYYRGEFDWAQAQLMVLKASTSELIANDALDLSVFIIDNLGLDTTVTPMMMFARADLLSYQNKLEDANVVLDSINLLFPGHNLTDDIIFTKANLAMKQGNSEKAVFELERVLSFHGEDLLADDATFMLAELYENELENPEKAQELYKTIIFDHKDSIYVVEARKRFRRLRGDDLDSEL